MYNQNISNGMEDSTFILVKSKGRRNRKNVNRLVEEIGGLSLGGGSVSLLKIESSTSTLQNDPYFSNFLSKITDVLEVSAIQLTKVVCYGLGNFSSSVTARFQLSLLILLAREMQIPVELFDPVRLKQFHASIFFHFIIVY